MYRLFLALFFLVFFTPAALAAPAFSSAADQTIRQYSVPTQVLEFSINADLVTPEITAAGDLKITIPEEFPAIWDASITTVSLSGTAVDAERFTGSALPVSYEDRDKTVVLDITTDFLAGESVQINGLYLEGFYQSYDATHFTLDYGAEATAADARFFTITRAKDNDKDTTPPGSPTGLTAVQTSDGVQLNWTDPTDRDLTLIEILRGVAPVPVSGSAYDAVQPLTETYLDTAVQLGDIVTYVLRASDGRNTSTLSTEVSLTIVEAPAACTAEYAPVCAAGTTYSNACQASASGVTDYTSGACDQSDSDGSGGTPATDLTNVAAEAGISTTELTSASDGYIDLDITHWSVGFLARLTRDGILNGYPDGTVQPDTTINRAELAKIATNSFNLTAATSSFSDVPADSWFAAFVGALEKAGAAWTTGTEYLPAADVSRGEAVWTILKSAGVELAIPTTAPFPDVSVSHQYAGAIAWAVEQGIVSGYENGSFGPADTLTRAQVAKVVVLLKEFLANN